MSIFDGFKRQLRSVIEWETQNEDILFYRWSSNGDEIKSASKLIVGPAQGCIFVYEGKIEAVFDSEGTYNLDTANIPFVTTISKFMQSFESEHKTAFYFYKKSIMANQKWGTSSPIKYVDPVYDFPVELIAYGNYSMQIVDPEKFFVSIVGTNETFHIDTLVDIVNGRLVHPLSDLLAESKISYNHIDAQREELGQAIEKKLHYDFKTLGFTLIDFRLEGTDFDEGTKERISNIATVKATDYAAKEAGVSYENMRKLDALSDAAKNESGAAGMFMGANAGGMLAGTLNEPFKSNEPSVEERLKKLKTFFDSNLINESEYIEKKQEILKAL